MYLLLDNYDSFTWNLVQAFGQLGVLVKVVRNDALSPADALAEGQDGIIISPGPCSPGEAGISIDLIQHAIAAKRKLLGVCLGHQALAAACGGQVVRAPQPIHGKVDKIYHHDNSLFRGLPNPCPMTRYHSLVAEKSSLPASLHIIAENQDGLIMGLQHKTAPAFGVQFHPESIASPDGLSLLKNFLDYRHEH